MPSEEIYNLFLIRILVKNCRRHDYTSKTCGKLQEF